jgi:putative effector of murein hydrolase
VQNSPAFPQVLKRRIASHGIGTARALQVNELAGAFRVLAMGLNALTASVLVPALWHLIFGG